MGTIKQGHRTKKKVLAAVAKHQPISSAEISAHVGINQVTVRDICRALKLSGNLTSELVSDANGRRFVWSVLDPNLSDDLPMRREALKPEPDHWTPQPWVHPIRQRILR